MRREYLLILLEFQSEDDPWMALRIHTYTGLLYQELVRNEAPGIADGRLPPVLPVVLYNGTEPWTAARRMSGLVAPGGPWLAPYQPAQGYFLLDVRSVAADDLPRRNLLSAVAGLEQSRSNADLLRVWEALQLWMRDPRAGELQRAFVDWIRQMAERLAPAGAAMPPLRTWEEVRMTLVERVAEWPKQWLREGREQGLEQGLDQQRALLCRQAPRASATPPRPVWPRWRGRSPNPNAWPRSASGWSVATPPPSSSPDSIPHHHPDAGVGAPVTVCVRISSSSSNIR